MLFVGKWIAIFLFAPLAEQEPETKTCYYFDDRIDNLKSIKEHFPHVCIHHVYLPLCRYINLFVQIDLQEKKRS